MFVQACLQVAVVFKIKLKFVTEISKTLRCYLKDTLISLILVSREV